MNETTENKEGKQKPVKKKKKMARWLKFFLYGFLVFIIVDIILIFFATPILKTYIQKEVSESTEGLFSIEFNKISFELSTRRIAIDNFNLIADTAVYNKLLKQKKAKAALYNIACGSIEMRGVSVSKLIFDRELALKSLEIIDPIVELKKLPNKAKKHTQSRDFVHKDIYPAVSKYVKEIKVDKINISNGKFLLSLQKDSESAVTHIGYITVSLFDFLLNKREFDKKERLFYSDDLQLNISQYRANLGDNIHIVYADTVSISTKQSKLIAVNVGLEPISKSHNFLKKLKRNYMQIKAPILEFKNFNINKLYFDKNVNIDKININSPEIKVVNKNKNNNTNNSALIKERKSIFIKLLEGGLNSIKINTFLINDANLYNYAQSWKNKPLQTARSLSLQFHNFDLSKNTPESYNKIFYSDSLELSVDTFTGKLPDKIHRLFARNIYISTSRKQIKAQAISVHPTYKSDKHQKLDIYIPALSISGTDFNRLHHKNILNIASLNIASSKFDIKLKPKEENALQDSVKKKKNIEIKNLFFKQIYVGNIRLGKSKFNIEKPVNDSVIRSFNGDISIIAKKLLLNKSVLLSKKHGFLLSEKFAISLTDYHQDLKDLEHAIGAKSLFVSNIDSVIKIDGFKIYTKDNEEEKFGWYNSNRMYDINFMQASVRGVDITRVLNNDELIANSVSIFKPDVNIYNNSNANKNDSIKQKRKLKKAKSDTVHTIRMLLGRYFKKVDINKLRINRANFKLAEIDSNNIESPLVKAKLSMKINRFAFSDSAIDNEAISYSDNIAIKVTDYFSKILNNNYQLKIRRLKFSSKDSVFTAKVVRLFPDSAYEYSNEYPSFLTFYAPLVESKSVCIKQLIDSNIINLGKLKITNPAFTISKKYLPDNISRKKVSKKKNKKRKFPRIVAQKINFANGMFGIIQHSKNDKKLQTTSDFDIEISNLNFDSSSIINPKSFLSELDVRVNLTKTKHNPIKKKISLNIDSLEFDNSVKLLTINNISYNSKEITIDKQVSLEGFDVDNISLLGLNLGELAINKKLVANNLFIDKPCLNLFNNKSNLLIKKSKLRDLNLYSKIKSSLKAIDLRKIMVDSIKLKLTTQESFNINTKIYDNMSAKVKNLLIDSLHQNDGRLFSADDFSFHIRNYATNISDSVYHLKINDLWLSTGRKGIFAYDISLNPNYTKEEYAKKVRKEFNLNYLDIKNVSVLDLDILELADNKNFMAGKINIDGIDYSNYKNKKYKPSHDRKIALPLDLVWKSKRMINIDTINVVNSYIEHETARKNPNEKGFINFTDLNAQLTNLTNIPSKIEKNNIAKLKASAYFMDDGFFNVLFNFNILSPIGEYSYVGDLYNFNMPSLNSLVENLFFVSIKSGKIDSLNFTVNANDDYANGILRMFYNNLKISLLDKKDINKGNVDKRGFLSMLANSIIRNKNRKFRTRNKIYFERNVYKSIFNYWSLSLLSGIKSALGFKSKELKTRLKQEHRFEKDKTAIERWQKRKDNARKNKIMRQELKENAQQRKYEKRIKRKNSRNSN